MQFVPYLLTLAGMHILMAMVPGPNTVIVSWLSATRSRRDGLRAVAGVVSATLVWVVFALWGVGILLLEAGWLYRSLQLLSAGYLIYVGVRMFRAGLGSPAEAVKDAQPRFGNRGPFATGLMTTLSNPKSAVFWTSAFLLAVPPHAPAWFYVAVVCVIAVQTMLWYGGVALFFSTGFARQQYMRIARRLDVVAGTVMIALGLKLADEVRRQLAVRAVS